MKKILIASLSTLALAVSADTHVISSVAQNMNHENRLIEGKGWSVHVETLKGGRSEGCQLITINNGTLVIRVIPTRGMGIYDVEKGDIRLGWDSPVPEIIHPSYIDLESRGGLGWLEGFNEWMVRCGLEFAGHPGTDENNFPLTLHGKIQNIPASEVSLSVEGNRLTLHGTVYEKFFYGPKLQLDTQVSTEIGSGTFSISDTITNIGGAEQEFQLIYHGNYGSSILEAGAGVVSAAKSVTPMDANAAKAIETYATYAGPVPGFQEEVYLLEPYGDAKGRTMSVLHNQAGDIATSLSWNIKELPHYTIWKNTTSREDGYVTGLEPATGYPFNRKVERHFGRVPTLAPGASRTFTIDYGFYEGTAEVQAAIAAVKQIQDGRKTTMHLNPPELPKDEEEK
ncbi:MAG: hypothetical protein ACI9TH_000133 [Kiritimatiellia bacterium]|jgi:hypothetical protein